MSYDSQNSDKESNKSIPKADVSKFEPIQGSVLVRIDNLPPGKSWKEVRYLIGGIIHHSNVVQVKMLPLMSSIVPPFVPFQSCLVTLKSQLNPESLNELLVSLNTYQWDYYNLYAYTLPPIDVMQQFMPVFDQPNGHDDIGMSPTLSNNDTELQIPNDNGGTPSMSYSTPVTAPAPAPAPAPLALTPTPARTPTPAPVPMPPPVAPGTPGPPPTPGMMAVPPPGSGLRPAAPFGGGFPAMAPYPSFMGGLPRRQYYQPPHIFGSRKFFGNLGGFVSSSGSPSGENNHVDVKNNNNNNNNNANGGNGHLTSNAGHNENVECDEDDNVNGDAAVSDGYMLSAATTSRVAAATAATSNQDFNVTLNASSRGNIANNNSKRLKQIFNEKTFRRQMTGRKMSQLQISGFPPFIKLDSWESIPLEHYRSLGEKGIHLIETDQPEKYGRLRWTILKDYIKLKCPRLLSLQDDNSSVENNTREFYVGVYEDHEETVGIRHISNEKEQSAYALSSAVMYKAIVGFNNKELCNLCMEALRDQEYSLGYSLEIKELPPFEEGQRGT